MSARTRAHVCAYPHMTTVYVRCACMCTHTFPPCPITCSNVSLYTHEGPLPRCVSTGCVNLIDKKYILESKHILVRPWARGVVGRL